jgi:hypothetical protein
MIYYCSIQLMSTRKSVCRQLESNEGHALLYKLRYGSINVPVNAVTTTCMGSILRLQWLVLQGGIYPLTRHFT